MSIPDEFWECCARHEFCLGYCQQCNTFHYYPQAFCPHCGSDRVELRPAAGTGRVLTYTHVMAPFYHSGTPFEIPYTIVLAELAEGVQILSKMDTYAPHIHADALVHIDFQQGIDRTIPVLTPSATQE